MLFQDNLDLPTSFITTPIVEGDEDTTDYLGTKYHTIKYFPDEDNIYNKTFSVEIICKIRDEEKFSSIDELKIQLKKDEQFCLKLINK